MAFSPRAALLGIFATAYVLLCCSFYVHSCRSSSLKAKTARCPNVLSTNNNIKRSDFPIDFLFGASTAAAQIEGSTKVDGRGSSIWDGFLKKYPGKVMGKNGMNTAIDSYRRYKEDMKAVKDLGVDSFRLSISWTRILPNGTLSGGVNQKGIDHYNSLINELIKYGIKPFVTILHLDYPQALQDKYGGPLNRSFVDDFRNYAEICFKSFGDRVKNWMTINEPILASRFGFETGIAAPGRCSDRQNCAAGNSSTEPYIAAHNFLLAHATAVRLYKQKFQAKQGGQIGLSLVSQFYEPYSNSSDNRAATQRALDFQLGWYMEPLVYGNYPKSMRILARNRLPSFTAEEKKLVKGAFDFVGLNYYTTLYAKSIPMNLNASPVSVTADQFVNATVDRDGVLIGPMAEGSGFIYIYPKGLQGVLEYVKKKYQNPAVYITENGVTEPRNDNVKLDVALDDRHRIDFILRHLYHLRRAMENGVKVKGYFYWSAFDDFEWGLGFLPRFGLYFIDYNNNLTRIPKQSAIWFHDFLKGNLVADA